MCIQNIDTNKVNKQPPEYGNKKKQVTTTTTVVMAEQVGNETSTEMHLVMPLHNQVTAAR